MSKEMDDELAALEGPCPRARRGEPFNLRSPGQLARILFDKLGLPVIAKGKTGPSTSADVLEALADRHENRGACWNTGRCTSSKVRMSTPCPAWWIPRPGGFTPRFTRKWRPRSAFQRQPQLAKHPGATGQVKRSQVLYSPRRMAVSQSGLQPDRAASAGPHVRRPSPDRGLPPGRRHSRETASEIFGIPLDQVTEEQRSAAKAINFGIVYGISSFGLGGRHGPIPTRGAGVYQRAISAIPRRETVHGRDDRPRPRERLCHHDLRPAAILFPDIGSRRYAERNLLERTAINTPIQGSAAEIIKMAMLPGASPDRPGGLGCGLAASGPRRAAL